MRYRTIVADPPWPYDEGWPGWSLSRDERSALPYPAMTLPEIKALPVRDLIAPEGYLFLWTTSRYLCEAFDVLRAWTLRYRQAVVWCKEPRGEGPGGMFATTTEFVLIGQRIGPRSNARGQRTLGNRIDSSWFLWPRGAHSQKPGAFQDLVEQVSPGPYLEMFARSQRLGWDTWGDEALQHVEIASWAAGASGRRPMKTDCRCDGNPSGGACSYPDCQLPPPTTAELFPEDAIPPVPPQERAANGDASVDEHGNCLGCGRKAEHVAEGAADDCPVCLAFLVWVWSGKS